MSQTLSIKRATFKRWITRVSVGKYLLLGAFTLVGGSLRGLSDLDTAIIEALALTNLVDFVIEGLLYLRDNNDNRTIDREFAVYVVIISIFFGILDLATVGMMTFNVFKFSERSFSYPLIISTMGIYRMFLNLIDTKNNA